MERDTFIITVYGLVEDEGKQLRARSRVRQAGLTPAWRAVEVSTMENCGEYFKAPTDQDLFGSFAQHYRHFFPTYSSAEIRWFEPRLPWGIPCSHQHVEQGLMIPLDFRHVRPRHGISTNDLPGGPGSQGPAELLEAHGNLRQGPLGRHRHEAKKITASMAKQA
jgi:hypothetical protein